LRLISWRPQIKNNLRGFAAIELPIGLKISGVPVLVGKNGPFAMLPGAPQIDRDGRHKRDANGKPAYTAILEWRDRDLADRFSAAVVELVRHEHPDAFVDGARPGEPQGPKASPRFSPRPRQQRQTASQP
jgi:hypothetical protein